MATVRAVRGRARTTAHQPPVSGSLIRETRKKIERQRVFFGKVGSVDVRECEEPARSRRHYRAASKNTRRFIDNRRQP